MDAEDLPRGPHPDDGDALGPTVAPAGDLHGPSLVLPALDGAHLLGPATIDSDADGLADTALVPGAPAGPDVLALATDLDHDGDVDVLTTLSADGSARTAAVPDGPGTSTKPVWDPGWDAAPPPAPVLDPATGAWTRTV